MKHIPIAPNDPAAVNPVSSVLKTPRYATAEPTAKASQPSKSASHARGACRV
jgi:hypothetical protein